jgi:hypothetical protein
MLFRSPDGKVQLKFMQVMMARVELILIHLHAVEQVLLKKGAVTEEELLSYIKEATSLPNTNLGMKTLKEMLQPKDGELTIQNIGSKVLKEMLADMQAEKGDANGHNESVRKS